MNTFIANDFINKQRFQNVSAIGLFSGTFAPFHTGHLSVLEKALSENECVVLLVSGYSQDRGDLSQMPLKERYKRLKDEFKDNPKVFVTLLDEHVSNDYGHIESLMEFKQSVFSILDIYSTRTESCVINNYVGDKEYVSIMQTYCPEFNTVLVDRTHELAVPISATKIRQDPFKYWDYILPSFYGFFRKVVGVVGASSTGKSTLVEQLAKYFNAPYSIEYGREYTEGWRHTIESDINARDYLAFINGQLTTNEDVVWGRHPSKVVFLDTEGIGLIAYLKLNLEEMTDSERQALITISELSAQWTKHNVDLILETPPHVEFQLDGSRDGHLEHFRQDFVDIINTEFNTRNISYTQLIGKEFHDRYLESIQHINRLLI